MQVLRERNTAGTVDQVLRLLRGESPRRVADECGATVDTVLDWQAIFVRAGAQALAEHGAAGDPRSAGPRAPLDTSAEDGPPLDWRLDEERLGNMVTTLGAMILEQKRTGS
jgi:hypothetical protein